MKFEDSLNSVDMPFRFNNNRIFQSLFDFILFAPGRFLVTCCVVCLANLMLIVTESIAVLGGSTELIEKLKTGIIRAQVAIV